jgi:hypothetical protein
MHHLFYRKRTFPTEYMRVFLYFSYNKLIISVNNFKQFIFEEKMQLFSLQSTLV